MNYTQIDWSQRDIIKKIKILTKQGTDTIYTFILMKYHKYPLKKLKHAKVLAQVNKPYCKLLLDMKP